MKKIATVLTAIILLSATFKVPFETQAGTTSTRVPHDPIRIFGDANFTTQNGVTRGSGTVNDPYVIEGWDIFVPIVLRKGMVDNEGIRIANTNVNFVIKDVRIYGEKGALEYGGSYSGVLLSGVQNGEISSTTIENGFFWGIQTSLYEGSVWCRNIKVGESIISENYCGIHIYKSDGIEIRKNIITKNLDGIKIGHTNSSRIFENKIMNNTVGIELTGSSMNRIYNNNVTFNNDGIAIYGGQSSENIVCDNYIISNQIGIRIGDISKNNKIYNNNFNNLVLNAAVAIPYEENFWNGPKTQGTNIIGGQFLGGNYWSDYTGTDSDGDGIGDTPYSIRTTTHPNVDYLPLVLTVPQKTKIDILNVQYQKWNTLNVPFDDVGEANDYIDDFQTTPSPADFGSIAINVILWNSGNYKAQGSIVAKLTGHVIMIAYGSETVVCNHDFSYELSFELQVEIGAFINKSLNLQVRYASIISTQLEPLDEYGNKVPLDVIISMVSIDVSITARGNFDEVVYNVPDVLGVGDPRDLLERWRVELWPKVKDKMLRVFLEKYYTEIVGVTLNFQTITDIPTGTYKPTINILPGATKIAVSLLIPAGITLVGLALLPLGAVPVGATLIAMGLAMVVINNPMPGKGMIILETGVIATAQMFSTSSTVMSLEIVQVVPNDVKTVDYVVNIPGNALNVIVTSNSTITGFGFSNDEIGFNTEGQAGTIGFTYLAVPKSLMSNITTVYVDGIQVNIVWDENTTHTFAYFTYTHPKHVRVVPEFSAFLMLSMMIVLLIAVIVRRLYKKHNNIHFFLFSKNNVYEIIHIIYTDFVADSKRYKIHRNCHLIVLNNFLSKKLMVLYIKAFQENSCLSFIPKNTQMRSRINERLTKDFFSTLKIAQEPSKNW